MINQRQQLKLVNEQAAQFQKAGHVFEVNRPDLGIYATLTPSRLELMVNDKLRVKAFSINLSDRRNAKILQQLAQGFDAKASSIGSVEEAIVQTSLFIKAISIPVLDKLAAGTSMISEHAASLDNQGNASVLTAKVSSDELVTISDQSILDNISNLVKGRIGPKRLGLELSALKLDYYGLDPSSRKSLCAYLMQTPGTKTSDLISLQEEEYATGGTEDQTFLEELLKNDPSVWKAKLWKAFGKDLVDTKKSNTESLLSKIKIKIRQEDEDKVLRAALQAVIDEMAQRPWLNQVAPSPTSVNLEYETTV